MFKQLEILGNEKEVSKIVDKTMESLETNYKIKISHEQLIPAFVNCFMDAFYFKSMELIKEPKKQQIETNLFDLLTITHVIDELHVLSTEITLGRLGMLKMGIPLNEEESEAITDVDCKLLESVSIKAAEYLETCHDFHFNKYNIIFKIAEVFLDEMLNLVKFKQIEDDTIRILDQFLIVIDEDGKFSSIETTSGQQEVINELFEKRMEELQKEQ